MPESSSVAYTVGGDSSTNSAELSVSWTSVRSASVSARG